MTYEEFLIGLRTSPRDWFLTDVGAIRYPEDTTKPTDFYQTPRCPLNRHMFPGGNGTMCRTFPDALFWAIASAADNAILDPRHITIRQELLDACGLKD